MKAGLCEWHSGHFTLGTELDLVHTDLIMDRTTHVHTHFSVEGAQLSEYGNDLFLKRGPDPYVMGVEGARGDGLRLPTDRRSFLGIRMAGGSSSLKDKKESP